MRFTVIYQNTVAIRDKVVALLLSAVQQGHDLSKAEITHPLFSLLSEWPGLKAMVNLPLNVQCEQMDLIDGSIRTVRVLVIDVETVNKT